MPLQLLRDRILVLPDQARDDVTSAGIVVPASKGIIESRTQFGRSGTVVAIGADVDRDQLKPGDRILWGEFDFPQHTENGVRHLVLQDADVCGVIEA